MGTTHVGAILMDLSANILMREWVPTHDGHTFPQVLEQTIDCIQKILDASTEYADRILGIGVGVPWPDLSGDRKDYFISRHRVA